MASLKTITIKVNGLDQARRQLRALGPAALEVGAAALYERAEEIMTESKGEVPVDLGVLRTSGHVQKPVQKFRSVSVTLGYGGAAAQYALVQHENTQFAHKVGKHHYLSDPVNRAVATLDRDLCAKIDLHAARLVA
jgi:hypothetical protein